MRRTSQTGPSGTRASSAVPGPSRAARRPPAPSLSAAGPSLLRAQRLGHRWPPVQRATLSVPTSETDDYDTIVSEAKLFHANQGEGVFYDVGNDDAEGSTADETHLDAFGHGNPVSIGDYNPETFADLVAEKRETLGLAAVNSVTLHSCESSTPLSLEDESTALQQKYKAYEGKSFVDRLHQAFFDKYYSFIEVSGFGGETYTDREGQTRLLKTGKTDKDYRRDMDAAKRLDVTSGGTANQDRVAAQYFQPVGSGMGTSGAGTAATFGLEAWAAPPQGLLDRFDLELENAQYLTDNDVRTVLNAILKDRFEDRAEPGEIWRNEEGILSGPQLDADDEGEEDAELPERTLLSGEAVTDRNRSYSERNTVGKIEGAHTDQPHSSLPTRGA